MGSARSTQLVLAVCLAASALLRGDEVSTEQRFQRALTSDPQVLAFLKRMPKGADLHNHCSGAVYAETWLDAAVRSQLWFNPSSGQFSETQTGGYTVPAQEVANHEDYAAAFLDGASMRGYLQGSTETSHDHFFHDFDHFSVPQKLVPEAVQLAEAINQARSQNIQYLEVSTRVVPGQAVAEVLAALPRDSADHLKDGLTDPTTLQSGLDALTAHFPELSAPSKALLDSLDLEVARLTHAPAPITGPQGPVRLRYIIGLRRLTDNATFFGEMACAMYLATRDPRIAGITILQAEDDLRARQHFDAQMAIIDFLWKRLGKPNMALHAGELTLRNTPLEVLRCRIRKSIELGHSKRLGHAVSIAWEDDLEGLFQELRDQGIAVEVCLSSNELILGVSGRQHPFRLYQEAGIPITLNTDDAGVNRSDLDQEYLKAIRSFGLDYKTLKTLARNSLEYSFLPGVSLYQPGTGTLRREFAGLRGPAWNPGPAALALAAASEKLAAEVKLELAFLAFEKGRTS